MKKVIILGGGVAGLSAAHELIERGFEVEVFEKNPLYYGGKARSINYHRDNHYENPLPAEHGFRFFPGFYKHIIDTMKRIPFMKNGKEESVFNNLTPTQRIMIARYGKPAIVTPASFPKSIDDIKLLIKDSHGVDSGLSDEEIHFFAERVFQLMTSCRDRRDNDYERLGWWQYLQADRFSEAYQHLLVEGLTRTLVAAKAETASTKTGGDIFLQLLYCSTDPTIDTDRVLDGPTNEKWLYPWTDYLIKVGVTFHQGVFATSVNMGDNSSIKSVTVKFPDGQSKEIDGDYYILAMPVERIAPLINEQMLAVEGRLQFIKTLAGSVSWMNGLQYYLSEDVEINQGHVICSDTEWALTCISQLQFWDDYDIKTKGDGNIRGILSVDISDWFTPGKYTTNKPAHECTREEVEKEVRAQLKASLNYEREVIRDNMIIDYYLDRDIREKSTADLSKTELENIEPLLVNTINSWGLRPDVDCDIQNLFFAGDYVRTYTDLATMEGANEAARRAVNCIIDKSGSEADDCKIWNLKEPYCFDFMKWHDNNRYKKGLPWTSKFPFWIKALTVFLGIFYMVSGLLVALIKGNGKSDPGSTKEKLFVIGSMIVTLGFAIFDAVMDLGYGSAFWLAIGMFSILALFAFGNKDKFLGKILLFGLVAGFVELLADYWLVHGIGSLVYPAEEAKFWASPNYMPFAWAVILTQVGYLGWLFTRKYNFSKAVLFTFILGALFIPIFETCALYAEWWYYNDYKYMFMNTPLYIIIGEGLIASALPFAFIRIVKKGYWAAAFLGIIVGLWIFAAYYLSYIIL